MIQLDWIVNLEDRQLEMRECNTQQHSPHHVEVCSFHALCRFFKLYFRAKNDCIGMELVLYGNTVMTIQPIRIMPLWTLTNESGEYSQSVHLFPPGPSASAINSTADSTELTDLVPSLYYEYYYE